MRALLLPFSVALSFALSCGGGLSGVASAAESSATPVDSQCAWGRLSDGQGRLVRCLTGEEAAHLSERSPGGASPAAVTAGATVPSTTPAAPAAAAPATPPTAAPGATASSLPPAPGITPVEPAAPPDAPPEELLAGVESVVADTGALPDAVKSLNKAKERFAECVRKNGGLRADRGEVEVRFLVQGRGRAEGVSLSKQRGMSRAAASCIVGVVDRRYVGYPDSPEVGATAIVAVTKKPKK